MTVTPIVPLAAFRAKSPPYWATILLAPTSNRVALTVMLAEADEPVPLSDATPICWLPAVNVTVPVGVAPLGLVTVAVRVTEPVDAIELADVCSATVADTRVDEPAPSQPVTRLYASTEPSPLA